MLYAASHGAVCLAEVFQESRRIDRFDGQPWLAAFRPTRGLHLLDLTGTWPTRAGASMAIASGHRARARRWAQAIYLAYPRLDGLLYPSSMYAGHSCLALWERARESIPDQPAYHRPLTDPALFQALDRTAIEIGYRLI